MKRFILFLVRMKLGLRKGQKFQFINQANKDEAFFIEDEVLKVSKVKMARNKIIFSLIPFEDKSNLSLNFLLSDEAKDMIIRL